MNQDELQERILMFNHLEHQEAKPAAPYDPSEGMNESELKNFVRFQYNQIIEKDTINQEILGELREMRQDYKELLSKFDSLTLQMEKERLENRDLKEQIDVLKNELYNSSKSRKGIEKNQRTREKHDDHENDDNENPSSAPSSDNNIHPAESGKNESASVYHGPSRKGSTYNKSVVGESIVHKCALNKLITALENVALQEGANVNVNEIWCRYRTHFGHRKTYMWTLVNRKAGIVIFFNEDCEDEDGRKHEGGRRRAVLKDFLGDAKIKSLQSDGYSVYMYLDDELLEIEHLCCLAHLRNKLKDAYNQGCEEARFFLEKIALLYRREDKYREDNLSPVQIKETCKQKYLFNSSYANICQN